MQEIGHAAANSATFTPEDIRWQSHSDPARNWAITRRQPVASLAVSGAIWGFSRSVPPPTLMIGRRLIVTAGSSHYPFNTADDNGRGAVMALFTDDAPQDAAAGDDAGPADHEAMFRARVKCLPFAQSVGAVHLAAAFIVGNVIDGMVYADTRPGTQHSLGPGERALGTWREFDRRVLPAVEHVKRGDWLWCFDQAHEFELDHRVAVKGFGGLWDYEKGLRLRGAFSAGSSAAAQPHEPGREL